jgi:hypothetical protein
MPLVVPLAESEAADVRANVSALCEVGELEIRPVLGSTDHAVA